MSGYRIVIGKFPPQLLILAHFWVVIREYSGIPVFRVRSLHGSAVTRLATLLHLPHHQMPYRRFIDCGATFCNGSDHAEYALRRRGLTHLRVSEFPEVTSPPESSDSA
jgi:hypothetical protein